MKSYSKSQKFLALAFVLSISGYAQAGKKYSLYFGGGGENEEKVDTTFDYDFETLHINAEDKGWNHKTYFDGGHSESEKKAITLTSGKNKSFTSENYEKAIENLKKLIVENKITAEDKLLITIDSHGIPKSGNLTHSVATIDKDISLDNLIELRQIAETKGVQIAFIDMSCFSGTTQALATDKTCVVSGTSSDGLAYPLDSETFFYNLNKADNLEELFLKSRSVGSATLGRPEISTQAGQFSKNTLKVLEYPNHVEVSSQIHPNSPLSCSKENQKKELDAFSAVLKTLKNQGKATSIENELKLRLRLYELQRTKAMLISENYKASELCGLYRNEEMCIKTKDYDPDLYDNQIRSNIKRLENIIKNTSGEATSLTLSELQKLKEEEKYISSIKRNPVFKEFNRDQLEYKNEINKLHDQALEIAELERRAYLEIYNEYSERNTEPNPCSSFRL